LATVTSTTTEHMTRHFCKILWMLILLLTRADLGMAEDASAGEKVFGKCKVCHQVGERAKNSVGPQLNGIVGRKAGTAAGYAYSAANKNCGLTWDAPTLKRYLQNPAATVPGTKKVFSGLRDAQELDDLILYLQQFGSDGRKPP
jgi:cytochrome c